jgi:ech hydrogenase subunit D
MITQEQSIIPIDVGKLIGSVEQCRNEGYRLVQIGGTKVDDNAFEINYSFDKDYVLKNLRITVTGETEVPSITGMYWGAFVYENEMHDLFGIQVKGINIDFKGTFIRTSVKYPFGVTIVKGEKP